MEVLLITKEYLLIDSREDSVLSETVEHLARIINIQSKKQFLEIGDYVINDICIEAKSAADFLASVRNKRIFNQIDNMDREYNRNFLVIYGTLEQAVSYLNHTKYNSRQWREKLKKMFIGAISSIALNTDIKPIWVTNVNTAAHFIVGCHAHSDKDLVLHKMLPKKIRTEDVRIDILCSITGITLEKAKILLEEFGSIAEISLQNPSEIMKIKGLGKVTSNNILKALNSEQEVVY